VQKYANELKRQHVPDPNCIRHLFNFCGQIQRVKTPFDIFDPGGWPLKADFLKSASLEILHIFLSELWQFKLDGLREL
jgi:hypothetical protein